MTYGYLYINWKSVAGQHYSFCLPYFNWWRAQFTSWSTNIESVLENPDHFGLLPGKNYYQCVSHKLIPSVSAVDGIKSVRYVSLLISAFTAEPFDKHIQQVRTSVSVFKSHCKTDIFSACHKNVLLGVWWHIWWPPRHIRLIIPSNPDIYQQWLLDSLLLLEYWQWGHDGGGYFNAQVFHWCMGKGSCCWWFYTSVIPIPIKV